MTAQEIELVVKQHSKPLIYIFNYMLYAFWVGVFLTYYFVNSYGGTMPAQGTVVTFIEDCWQFAVPLIGSPLLIKVATKLFELKREKKLQSTYKRRTTDRK